MFIKLSAQAPNNLPEISVRITEIPAVSAPKDILNMLYDPAFRFFCQLEDFGYLFLVSNIVSKCEAGESRSWLNGVA